MRTGEWHEHGGRIVQTCLGSRSNLVWLELQMEEKWKSEVKERGHLSNNSETIRLRSKALNSRKGKARYDGRRV